jgi:hypothetical protein
MPLSLGRYSQLLQKEEEARGGHGVKEPLVVWPAVVADLEETQTAWLRGESLQTGASAEQDDEDGEEKIQGAQLRCSSFCIRRMERCEEGGVREGSKVSEPEICWKVMGRNISVRSVRECRQEST